MWLAARGGSATEGEKARPRAPPAVTMIRRRRIHAASLLALLPLLSLLAPSAEAAPPAIVYKESFDGTGGTMPSGWATTFTTHISHCRAFTPSWSLGFTLYNPDGCPEGLQNSQRVVMSATTPNIWVPTCSPCYYALAWNAWYDTESDPDFDKKLVYITKNGGATWTLIHQELGPARTWLGNAIDISAWKGYVRVMFVLDTIDADLNTGEGWYVDDLVIHGASRRMEAKIAGSPNPAPPGEGLPEGPTLALLRPEDEAAPRDGR